MSHDIARAGCLVAVCGLAVLLPLVGLTVAQDRCDVGGGETWWCAIADDGSHP